MRPRSISASSINNFEECPAKFKAANIDRVPEVGPKTPAMVGTSCHDALEEFVQATCVRRDAEWSFKLLASMYDTAYAKVFNSADKETDAYKDGLSMLKGWYRRTDEYLGGVEVLMTEKKIQVPIRSARTSDESLLTFIFDRADLITEQGVDGPRKIIKVVDYKGLALDTIIPTIHGWTTMGEIRVGDFVFGGDSGVPCRVAAKSEVKHKPCFRITFDDGSELVADHEHRWEVRHGYRKPRTHVMTTEEMHALGAGEDGVFDPSRAELAITHAPVHQVPLGLPVDPYRSGLDGVLDPFVMRSSYTQRLEMLRGLMDSRGHWKKSKRRGWVDSVSSFEAERVRELVCSLGWVARVERLSQRSAVHRVAFSPSGANPFKDRADECPENADSAHSTRRLVAMIEPVETVPTQCIEVDSPDHCFRVGRGFIKTHNTQREFVPPDKLKSQHRQARIYALAAAVQFRDHRPDEIIVELDLLRYSPVAASFTREDNMATRDYLRETLQMIIDTDGTDPPRSLNSGCRYCPVRMTCPQWRKNREAGGDMSLESIEQAVYLRAELEGQKKLVEGVLGVVDDFIVEHAKNENEVEFEVPGFEVKLTSRSARKVDSEEAARIIGPELMGRFGSLRVTDIEALIKGDMLDEHQKSSLGAAIRKEWGPLGVKIKPTALGD